MALIHYFELFLKSTSYQKIEKKTIPYVTLSLWSVKCYFTELLWTRQARTRTNVSKVDSADPHLDKFWISQWKSQKCSTTGLVGFAWRIATSRISVILDNRIVQFFLSSVHLSDSSLVSKEVETYCILKNWRNNKYNWYMYNDNDIQTTNLLYVGVFFKKKNNLETFSTKYVFCRSLADLPLF